MATKVILSSSTHADYAFPVGIAALLWREAVGYQPWTFLCGSADEWKAGKPRVTLDFMRELELFSYRVDVLPEWPAYVTAQNCRYHASALGFADDIWLMLSDADLFPLRRDFYHQHEDYAGRFAFYYSNGDHGDNYPTCHIAARAKDWLDVIGLVPDGNLHGQMRANLRAWFDWMRLEKMAPNEADHCLWMVDMHSFMARIKSKSWHPAECKMIERAGHPPKDRLDRSNWPARYNVADYTDAHLLKATHEPANWDRTRPIIEALLPKYLARIDRYVQDFRSA